MDAMLDMEGHSTSVKELELVMKCMWKVRVLPLIELGRMLTFSYLAVTGHLSMSNKHCFQSMKKLQEDFNLSSADIQPLLRQIAAFFKRLPSFMWKDHPKDTPYR